MSKKTVNNNGVGVVGLLGVVFVVLKLTGHIDWSWMWVTAPFWIPFAVVVVVLAVLGITYAAISFLQYLEKKQKKRGK